MSRRWILGLALCLVLVLRIGVIFVPGWDTIAADEVAYHGVAISLLQGQGYTLDGAPISDWPPLYPIFLAAIYFLVESPLAVYFAHALLAVGAAYGLYRLALLLFDDRTVALLSAFIFAGYPLLILVSKSLLSENLYVALLTWHLLFLQRGVAKMHAPSLYASAVLLGLAALTRTYIALIIVLYAAMLLVMLRAEFGTRARTVLTYVLFFALTLLPWTLRNYLVFDAFIPLTTSVGGTLYAGYSASHYVYGNYPSDDVTKAADSMGAIERNRYLMSESFKTVVAQPSRLPGLIVKKLAYFVMPFDYEILPRFPTGHDPGFDTPYVFLFPFFLAGAWQARKSKQLVWPVLGVIGYTLVIAILILGLPRYRLPIEPFMLLFASYALSSYRRHPYRRVIYTLVGAYLLSTVLLAIYAVELKELLVSFLG